jgi:hypothetical protein
LLFKIYYLYWFRPYGGGGGDVIKPRGTQKVTKLHFLRPPKHYKEAKFAKLIRKFVMPQAQVLRGLKKGFIMNLEPLGGVEEIPLF